jgi:DNA repair exonuclease SbcCD ATPase subunit
MDGVENILTLEQVAEQLMRNKLETHQRIQDIHSHLEDGDIRMDNIESTLSKHEAQRKQNNEELKSQLNVIRKELNSYRNDFNAHDRVEMEKYDKIIEALHELTEQLKKTAKETDLNTLAIEKRKHEEEIDKAVQEALEADHANYKAYKKNAINAVIGIVTTGMIVGIWKLTVFISNLDKVPNGTP